MTSYLHNLRCSRCGTSYDPTDLNTYCHLCQSTLLAEYDLTAAGCSLDRDIFRHRRRGMWRWSELLPVQDPTHQISLGEGDTPLLKLNRLGKHLQIPGLYLKEEGMNPTGSFKARGLSAAISKACELGVEKVIIPTAGNAGGALAAYAARAGLKACVIMPMDTPAANVEETRIAGAEIIMVDGLISDAAQLTTVKARGEGWFDISTFKEPYRCEGKKIMGYELAEEMLWELPDVILYPTGGGTGLVGMVKAFDEMARLGWLENAARPRMVAVQAEGCSPVVKAFHAGEQVCEFWKDAQTIASGLRVPRSFADHLILRDLRASKGTAVAVSDEEIISSQKLLASQEGIFSAPEGAATLAGLMQLIGLGWIRRDERVVLFNTGTGLKYL